MSDTQGATIQYGSGLKLNNMTLSIGCEKNGFNIHKEETDADDISIGIPTKN